jgi:cobalt transporter subunit CbtB
LTLGDAGRTVSFGPHERKHTMTSPALAQSRPAPVAVSEVLPWLVGALLLGLGLYYLVGIDEGATSVFGNTMAVHELVHDARHFLGFPCH